MAANDSNQKVRQLKEKLEMCKDFIKNAQKEAEKDLAECQKDYQDACRELDRAKNDYQRELKKAEIEHYSAKQMQTMENMMQEGIALAEKHKNQASEYLQDAKKHTEELPELLKLAKEEQESLEEQLAIYDTGISGPPAVIGGAIIWAIIIFILFKACGG